MGTIPNLLTEENVREIIIGAGGLIILGIIRELRRRNGKADVESEVRQVREEWQIVRDAYADLHRAQLTAIEQRELDAYEKITNANRRVRELERDLIEARGKNERLIGMLLEHQQKETEQNGN